MSDEPISVDGTDACSVCGLEVMASLVVAMPPLGLATGYAACPFHLDTVVARMHEMVRAKMDEYDGVLTDWWTELHPPPVPQEAP